MKFLAEFLDDETARKISADSKRYEGPCAAFTFPLIRMRDFAAMQIAWQLDFPEDPQPDWSAEEWAALREKAKQAVAKR